MKSNLITADSFGSDIPENWEEIADYLNDIIRNSSILFDEEDTANLVWENYWNGCYPNAPKAKEANHG